MKLGIEYESVEIWRWKKIKAVVFQEITFFNSKFGLGVIISLLVLVFYFSATYFYVQERVVFDKFEKKK